MSAIVAVVRKTSLVTDSQVAMACRALQTQVSRDFAPAWGSDAKIVATVRPPKGSWVVSLVDHVGIPGALGYHETSNHRTDGTPIGFVGIADDQKYGLSWTVTLGHEVLEMLADPTANAVMPYPGGRSVALEVGDPCEADALGYRINGLLQTDFALPAWFTGKGVRYDFGGHIAKPLTLASGGYMSILENGVWSQVTKRAAPGVTSRIRLSTRHASHQPPK